MKTLRFLIQTLLYFSSTNYIIQTKADCFLDTHTVKNKQETTNKVAGLCGTQMGVTLAGKVKFYYIKRR